MKFSLKQDSLAFQLARPGLQYRDMSAVKTTMVGAQCRTFRASNPTQYLGVDEHLGSAKGSPEEDALAFYLMNHAVALVAQRVGPYDSLKDYLPIVQKYHEVLAVRTLRMFFYMLLICTRESRHRKDNNAGTLMLDMASKYGMACVQFNNSIKGAGSDSAANAFCDSPPDVSLGKYTAFLADLFNKGSYSGGYGGKAWGKVAEVLRDFVHGKLTAEMMMDTAFTLCHNNGPIFNKGMLFTSYSDQIYKILDVQRAGMIPQLVGDAASGLSPSLVTTIKPLWEMCHSVLGGPFEGHVDWYAVEKLGAMKSYPAEKSVQAKLYGVPSTASVSATISAVKTQMEAAKTAKENAQFILLHPGCSIKMVERDVL